MKKIILFLFAVIFALCSCYNKNDKHAYLITIDAPVTYNVMGIRQTLDAKYKCEDLGIIKDSVSLLVNNLISRENRNTQMLLDLYYELKNKKYKDDIERMTVLPQKVAFKSQIGKSVILIVVSETLVSEPSMDDLIRLYKEKNPEIESYYIYDGSSTLAEIEIEEEYTY